MDFSDVLTLLALLTAVGAVYWAVSFNQEKERLSKQSELEKKQMVLEKEQLTSQLDKERALSRQISEQLRQVEQSKEGLELVQKAIQQEGTKKIDDERSKLNGQLATERKRLEQEKHEQIAELRKAHSEERLKLKEQAVTETVYTLIVDGPPDAGKSSLIYKLMNPGGDISLLEASPTGWESPLWPIIFVDSPREQNEPRNLYCIKAHDIAGEAPYCANDLAGKIDAKRGVIIIVVDILQLEEALNRFTSAFIKAQYFTAHMLKKADSAIVYVNKIDRSVERFPDVDREQVERLVAGKLQPMLQTLNQRYPGTKVVFGSAKTEENLFKLLAEIHRSMHISDKFPKHPSASEGAALSATRNGRA